MYKRENKLSGMEIEQELLKEVLDIELLNQYLQNIYEFTKIPITILDLEGKIVVASKWTRLCEEYMRSDENSSLNCLKVCSTIGAYNDEVFKCPNGLCMYRVPIEREGKPIAFLVLSQFLMKQPDPNEFKFIQKNMCLSDLEYNKLLDLIPVVTEKEIQKVIKLFRNFVLLLHDMIARKMKTKELEEEVMQSYEELEASYQDISSLNDQLSLINIELQEKNKEISNSEKRYRILIEKMHQGTVILRREENKKTNKKEYIVIEMNPAMQKKTDKQDIIDFIQNKVKLCIESRQKKITYQSNHRYYEIEAEKISGTEVLACVSDISGVYEKLIYKHNQMWNLVETMGALVEKRDLYTADHQKQVAILAVRMAIEMQLTEKQVESVYVASLLHDIGKISIPAEILTKPDRLTEIEYELIKTHVINAFDILSKISFTLPITEIVMQHHERLNGTGYPNGLFEQEICMEAKIVAVADVYEAITSHRPYRPSLGRAFAIAHLQESRGVLYDSRTVEACERITTLQKWNNEDVIQYLKDNRAKIIQADY